MLLEKDFEIVLSDSYLMFDQSDPFLCRLQGEASGLCQWYLCYWTEMQCQLWRVSVPSLLHHVLLCCETSNMVGHILKAGK